MSNGNSTSVNIILIGLVGLLVGFIGGYMVGQSGNEGLPAAASITQSQFDSCPHTLPKKDAWILAGFRCPGTPDAQALLLDCHCPVAHGIHDRVNSELAAGKDGNQIRDELVAEYGDQLKLHGQR